MSWREQAEQHFERENRRKQRNEELRARLGDLQRSARVQAQQEEEYQEKKWEKLQRMMRGK